MQNDKLNKKIRKSFDFYLKKLNGKYQNDRIVIKSLALPIGLGMKGPKIFPMDARTIDIVFDLKYDVKKLFLFLKQADEYSYDDNNEEYKELAAPMQHVYFINKLLKKILQSNSEQDYYFYKDLYFYLNEHLDILNSSYIKVSNKNEIYNTLDLLEQVNAKITNSDIKECVNTSFIDLRKEVYKSNIYILRKDIDDENFKEKLIEVFGDINPNNDVDLMDLLLDYELSNEEILKIVTKLLEFGYDAKKQNFSFLDNIIEETDDEDFVYELFVIAFKYGFNVRDNKSIVDSLFRRKVLVSYKLYKLFCDHELDTSRLIGYSCCFPINKFDKYFDEPHFRSPIVNKIECSVYYKELIDYVSRALVYHGYELEDNFIQKAYLLDEDCHQLITVLLALNIPGNDAKHIGAELANQIRTDLDKSVNNQCVCVIDVINALGKMIENINTALINSLESGKNKVLEYNKNN